MKDSLVKETLNVAGKCDMCVERIENAAGSVEGVSGAKWDKETKELEVAYDPSKTSVADISKALAAVGHDAGSETAPDDIYESLPSCCKYR